MMHETLKKLTDEDLANVCGGQNYIYYVFDEKQQKKKYYIPREDGILIIYNETKIEEQYGDRVIRHCRTCKVAECYSWSVVDNFHSFSSNGK